MTANDILERLTRVDLSSFGVKLLGVFGSVARGEAKGDSDVDLLVEFDGPATLDRYLDLEFFLEDLIGAPVDLFTRRSLPPTLRQSIERDIRYVPGSSTLPGRESAQLWWPALIPPRA